ncbi:MAG TPA: FAD-binding oxidoreductase [Candidatus Eisenbacteria bacterium]|nr:FAD-binding oxidoreductase [Candidatus Eisenbacteria bacterium]
MTAAIPGLDPSAARDLRARLTGELVLPEDAAYDDGRRVWNGMIDKRPAAIVRPRSEPDVAAAILTARVNGLQIAVRGGGHNIAGASTVDGGMVIDLRLLNAVTVDADARRAIVGGGALLRELDSATAAVGLCTTAGMVSHTGVGGLTLGGGYGWLARMYGLACDNLVGVTVVTAAGEVVRATETENADLLWGLRGGGGNFGVATEFEFRLHRLPPVVSGGTSFFRYDDALPVIRNLLAAADGFPDRFLGIAAATLGRADHHLPAEFIGQPVAAIDWGYLGEYDEGRRVIEPVIAGHSPVLETPVSAGRSYRDLQTQSDENMHPGQRMYWKSSFISSLPDAGIEAFLTRGAGSESPVAGVEIVQLGGAISRVGEDDTAFSHRDARFDFLAVSGWEDPAEDDVRIEHVRRAWGAVAPFASQGSYVNNMGDEGNDRVRAAYGDAKYRRLQALKDRYDPDNVFHRNANIRPSAIAGPGGQERSAAIS